MSALARLAPVSPKIGTNAGGSVPPLLKNALSALATLRWLGLVFLTGTAAAATILRIELRSSRYFRFESRRRSAASEKVWIVERPLIVLESVRDRILPLCRPACVIELRQLIRSHVPFIERL